MYISYERPSQTSALKQI